MKAHPTLFEEEGRARREAKKLLIIALLLLYELLTNLNILRIAKSVMRKVGESLLIATLRMKMFLGCIYT